MISDRDLRAARYVVACVLYVSGLRPTLGSRIEIVVRWGFLRDIPLFIN